MSASSIISISSAALDCIQLNPLGKYLDWCPDFRNFFLSDPGQEHYKLLALIASQIPSGHTISDVGMYRGSSALALSFNENIKVVTYDIENVIPQDALSIFARSNVEVKLMRGQDDIAAICKSDVVVLDIDPHDGPSETEFVNLLIENNFRGLLVCDDIHINEGMRTFWNTIPSHLKKVDVTQYGHWSGTGIVVFDPQTIDITIE